MTMSWTKPCSRISCAFSFTRANVEGASITSLDTYILPSIQTIAILSNSCLLCRTLCQSNQAPMDPGIQHTWPSWQGSCSDIACVTHWCAWSIDNTLDSSLMQWPAHYFNRTWDKSMAYCLDPSKGLEGHANANYASNWNKTEAAFDLDTIMI